jgi:putative flippase GtrA
VRTFNRYFLVSIASFLIDLSLFVILYSSESGIFQAAIAARIISAVFSFSLNKYYVFKSSKSSTLLGESVKFFFLAILTAFIGAIIINALGLLSVLFASIAKFLIDSILFVLNFFLQKKIIFSK